MPSTRDRPPPKQVVGYCTPLTCRPGDAVAFMVSCDRPVEYDVDLVQLICADRFDDGAGYEERLIAPAIARRIQGRHQVTAIGSRAIVDHPVTVQARRALTIAAVIRPTATAEDWQAVVGAWRESTGAGAMLALLPDGRPAVILGDGQGKRLSLPADRPLVFDRWSIIALTVDTVAGTAAVWHRPLGRDIDTVFRGAGAARADLAFVPALSDAGRFCFAAHDDEEGRGVRHFNGRIEAPRFLSGSIAPDATDRLLLDEIPADLAGQVVGWWDFSQQISSRSLIDVSGNAAHGTVENLPNRAVPGHRWNGDCHDWRDAPDHYAAVHFHADDIYDAGWHADFEWQIPDNLSSGVYAARLTSAGETEHIPFFVLPPARARSREVAFLASTATYLAYANIRTLLGRDPPFGIRTRNEATLAAHPEFGHSTYDRHLDGSGVHYSSPHRPILNLKPGSYRWGFCADMNVVAWLTRCGHEHDVLTDEALNREGIDLLRRYSVIVTGTHPEYFSTAMLDAVERYLAGGGRLIYLGGNGFYWRIAHSLAWPGAIEVRRAEGGTRPWIAEPGEYRHAFTGELGGLWRRLGRPPNRLVGVGFSGQGFPTSTHYRRAAAATDERARFIFEGVGDDVIGDFGANGGGAAGEEVDRFDAHLGSPSHALVVASSESHPSSVLRTIEEVTTTNSLFRAGQVQPDPDVRADLVFFECPNGGAVFSTGSIAWAGSLAYRGYDNCVARITNNVINRFKAPGPVE